MSSQVLQFPGVRSPYRPVSPLSDPRVHQAFLLLASVLVIFTRLWETTLSSYDDAFYAEKAKEILLTGQWLVPPWDYQPNFDNPPLYFWATAVLFRLFGVSEFTARFVSAACGVGCIVLTYRFGRRLFGPWVGLFSGFALLSTPYFIKYSRHAMLDTTQTLLVGCSLYLLVLGLQRQRTGWTDLASGLLMGLAVLNKSLLGYLPLAIYAVYVLASRAPLRRALRPGLLVALPAALILPGAWFAAVIARHGSAPLERHFGYVLWQRAVEGDPGQVVRWTSGLDYLVGLCTNFQPWILLSLYGAWRLYRKAEAPRRGLVPIAWAGTVLLLLSLAAAKKSWYVMPAYPALAMLAGVGLDGLISEAHRWRERVAAILAALVGAYILVVCCTPLPMDRDRNRDVAAIAPAVRAAVPPGEHVICFDLEPHWRYVSALYFYGDRPLSLPVKDMGEMERIVTGGEAWAILTGVETWDRLRERLGMEPPVLASSGDLILLGPLPRAGPAGPMKRSGPAAAALIVALLFAGLALSHLLLPVPKGMADNGDFARTMRALGLEHESEDRDRIYFQHMARYYRVRGGALEWPFPTSALLFPGLAFLPGLWMGGGRFDVVALGLTYTLLAGGAIFALAQLLLRNARGQGALRRWGTFALLAAVAWIASDPSYVLFFNSFYTEPAGFVFLLAAAAALVWAALSRAPGSGSLAAALLACCLLALAKPQNLLAGLLGLAALALVSRARPGRAAVALMIVAAGLPIALFLSLNLAFPRSYNVRQRFNATYYGVALVSASPSAALERLGLPAASDALVGHRYDEEFTRVHRTDEDLMGQVAGISRLRLAGLYLTDPAALRRALGRTVDATSSLEVEHLGNYPTGYPPGARAGRGPWTWSASRRLLAAGAPGLWVLYPALLLVGVLLERWLTGRTGMLGPALAFLSLYALSQYPVVVLGDGFSEHRKHLLMACFAADLALPLSVLHGMDLVTRARRPWEQSRSVS